MLMMTLHHQMNAWVLSEFPVNSGLLSSRALRPAVRTDRARFCLRWYECFIISAEKFVSRLAASAAANGPSDLFGGEVGGFFGLSGPRVLVMVGWGKAGARARSWGNHLPTPHPLGGVD